MASDLGKVSEPPANQERRTAQTVGLFSSKKPSPTPIPDRPDSQSIREPLQATRRLEKPESLTKVSSASPHKTLALFAGSDEASSQDFQSLRDQLSTQDKTDKPDRSSAVGELSFGLDQEEDMGFGFSQDQADERTFLEFSDVDDQTVFEEDHDESIRVSHHKTLVGQPISLPEAPQVRQTQSFFSSDIPPPVPPRQTEQPTPDQDLLEPDFIEDFQDDLDPSRVLPIPAKTSRVQDGRGQPVGQSVPVAQTVPMYGTPAPPDKPVSPTPAPSRLQVAQAMDWPEADQASSYTPPTPPSQNKAQPRKTPKLQSGKQGGRKLLSLLLSLTFVSAGGVGVYWVASNWEAILRLAGGEKAQSLNVTTSPSKMTVWIDGRPSQEAPPFIFLFKPDHVVNEELKLRFIWKAKVRRKRVPASYATSIPILAGASNLYFAGGGPSTTYAQTLIDTNHGSLQVTLNDQPIGQTPLFVIGAKEKNLSIVLTGPGIEQKLDLTLGDPNQKVIMVDLPPPNQP